MAAKKQQIPDTHKDMPMLAIITIITVGLVVGIMMLLAASMLSSHISSMETDYIADETVIKQPDPETPAGTISP